MRVLVGYTNHIPQVATGRSLPGREGSGDSILAFGTGYTGMKVTPAMTWADILACCPGGWRPDVYIHWSPEYNPVPQGLQSADCLTVGVWGDWNLGGRAMRAINGLFDLLVADERGCERLRGMGFDNVLHGLLWAFDPAKHRRLSDAPNTADRGDDNGNAPRRDIDILMIGNFNHAVQWERAPWLARVAALSAHYNVLLTSGLFDDAYVRTMNRAKIVFNRSIRGEANMRAYEAPACGALMFYEAANLEIHAIYEDRRHCVLYDENNLEELLAYYLAPENEAERASIAQAGWERAQAHSYAHHFADLLCQIEPLLPTRQRSFGCLPVVQQQTALALQWMLTCSVSVYHKTDAFLRSLDAAPTRTGGGQAAQTGDQKTGGGEAARIADLHAVLCGEIAHCAVAPDYKRQMAQSSLRHARRAVACAPDALLPRFNLAYLTLAAGNIAEAETLLCEATGQLDALINRNATGEEADTDTRSADFNEGKNENENGNEKAFEGLDGPLYPHCFDWFNVAVERLFGEYAACSPQERRGMLALLTARAHLTLAEIAYARGRFAPSADHAARACRAVPTIGEAQYALALAQRAQGRVEPAVAAYRRTLALQPFHSVAREELAQLLLDAERPEEAEAALDDWLAILKGCPVYADCRPLAYALRRQARQQQNGAGESAGREKRLLALPDWSNAHSWQRVVEAFARLGVCARRPGFAAAARRPERLFRRPCPARAPGTVSPAYAALRRGQTAQHHSAASAACARRLLEAAARVRCRAVREPDSLLARPGAVGLRPDPRIRRAATPWSGKRGFRFGLICLYFDLPLFPLV